MTYYNRKGYIRAEVDGNMVNVRAFKESHYQIPLKKFEAFIQNNSLIPFDDEKKKPQTFTGKQSLWLN